uniref:Uncharacterized protein n=1 Tax=Candidatus Kentrum sp. SD TaxID=2126332 RepID=A0A450YDB4_9GAMM|nr:MAG: hypothetical protein BECKSD772F_GA0070984_10403 [Candidatus Kentron sp. SD]VFK44563.1 MAG: hypothetical protein BECKSD772E_GA0070983_10403 [Candidatus Kentron sp. SD]
MLAEARAAWSRLVNVVEPNPAAIAEARDKVERDGGANRRPQPGVQGPTGQPQPGMAAGGGRVADGFRSPLPQAFQPFDLKTDKFSESHWLALLIPAAASAGLVAKQFARLRAAESRENAAETIVPNSPIDSTNSPGKE